MCEIRVGESSVVLIPVIAHVRRAMLFVTQNFSIVAAALLALVAVFVVVTVVVVAVVVVALVVVVVCFCFLFMFLSFHRCLKMVPIFCF